MNLIDNAKHQGKRKKLILALKSMGIESEQVLQAMLKVPRHYFLDSSFEDFAYQNKGIPNWNRTNDIASIHSCFPI